ncbi:MAG: glycosyltransferase [Halioglobus sp.]
MIFAMTGTHEQQFDRLVKALDNLKTDEPRIVQFGYSEYKPDNCEAYKFLEFEQVKSYMLDADVVITHSGTGSVMLALSLGKLPIVAPRYARLGEHVDDHQLQLVKTLEADGLVVPYYEGDSLEVRIQEALKHEKSTRKIEPDPRLVADIRAIIDQS